MLMKIVNPNGNDIFGFIKILNTKEWKQVKFFDGKIPLQLKKIKINGIVLILYDQLREVVNNKRTYKESCCYVLHEGQAIYIPKVFLKEVQIRDDL